jgi:hypothetical protein
MNSPDMFWLIEVAGGPILLGIVLAFAGWQWRHRALSLAPLRQAVTKQNYKRESE